MNSKNRKVRMKFIKQLCEMSEEANAQDIVFEGQKENDLPSGSSCQSKFYGHIYNAIAELAGTDFLANKSENGEWDFLSIADHNWR